MIVNKKAVVWGKDNCQYCDAAIALLTLNNYNVTIKKLGIDYTKEELLAVVGYVRTVPQIFINDKHIGTYSDLLDFIENDNI